jgi:tetratricopeptide (TPR) repeat protein
MSMSDSTPTPDGPFEEFEGPPPPTKQGLLADPVVRIMVFVSIGLVVLFLVTVLGTLVTGVVGTPTGPRSAAERQLATALDQSKGKVGEATAPYINALITAGNLSAARVALTEARGSVVTTVPLSDLDLAEARLFGAEKKYPEAIALADTAMKGYKAEYDQWAKQNPEKASAIKNPIYAQDYYNAVLVKAEALAQLKRWKDAIGAFDIYLATNATASDILIERGNAKAELNDKAGAEKDFRAALMFVPYDEEAKAGLKRIGVAQ